MFWLAALASFFGRVRLLILWFHVHELATLRSRHLYWMQLFCFEAHVPNFETEWVGGVLEYVFGGVSSVTLLQHLGVHSRQFGWLLDDLDGFVSWRFLKIPNHYYSGGGAAWYVGRFSICTYFIDVYLRFRVLWHNKYSIAP